MPIGLEENAEDLRSGLVRLQRLRHFGRQRDRAVEQGERSIPRGLHLVPPGGTEKPKGKNREKKDSPHI
mgnify:CR=1 FL=1